VSWWRRRKREVALDDHDRVLLDGEGSSTDELLLTAVRLLPKRQREVVVMRIWLDRGARPCTAAQPARCGRRRRPHRRGGARTGGVDVLPPAHHRPGRAGQRLLQGSSLPFGSHRTVYFSVFAVHKGEGYAKFGKSLVMKGAPMKCRTIG
jgi:hypothetical protein